MIHLIQICYAPSRIFKACVDQIYKTVGCDLKHTVLNNHYPVNQEQNDKEILEICKNLGIIYLDQGKNLGLSGGYNYLMQECGADHDSVVILSDPDTYPVTYGWGDALQRVASDKRIGWTSLTFPAVDGELSSRGFDPDHINGVHVQLIRTTCMSSICATRVGVYRAIGGINEGPGRVYGGAESTTHPKLKNLGFRWAYLRDFKEEPHESVTSEPLYREWKWAYCHGTPRTELTFEEWLRHQRPEDLEALLVDNIKS